MPNYHAYHLNFTQAQFYVLAVLSTKQLSPYSVYQQVAHESLDNVCPARATIKQILERFTALGLLEETIEGRQRFYTITEKGMYRLRLEIRNWDRAIGVARSHLIWYNNAHGEPMWSLSDEYSDE